MSLNGSAGLRNQEDAVQILKNTVAFLNSGYEGRGLRKAQTVYLAMKAHELKGDDRLLARVISIDKVVNDGELAVKIGLFFRYEIQTDFLRRPSVS